MDVEFTSRRPDLSQLWYANRRNSRWVDPRTAAFEVGSRETPASLLHRFTRPFHRSTLRFRTALTPSEKTSLADLHHCATQADVRVVPLGDRALLRPKGKGRLRGVLVDLSSSLVTASLRQHLPAWTQLEPSTWQHRPLLELCSPAPRPPTSAPLHAPRP